MDSSNNPSQQEQDHTKDIMMKDMNAVDPKVNSEEKTSTATPHGQFHNTFSRNTLKLSAIKDVKVRMQERVKTVKPSSVMIFITILIIIGIFAIPAILYYTLRTDPLPEFNGAFTDVNISMSTLLDCRSISEVHLDSKCTKDVIYTYEYLIVASVFTNEFCNRSTYQSFCEALEHCNSGQDADARELLCTQVRQNICTAEWRILEVNNRSMELIDCQEFGETSRPNCTEQFDLADNDSVCLPLCKEFSRHGEKYTDFIVPFHVVVHIMNTVGGIIVIIVSVLNRANMLDFVKVEELWNYIYWHLMAKDLFKFPQILMLLNACILTSTSIFYVLSTISRSWNPVCSQRFLTGHLSIVGAIDDPSPFCETIGFFGFAGFLIYSVYWLLYAFHLYIKIAQPQYSMLLDSWNRTKKFYYLEVAIFTVIVTVPYMVLAGLSEFRMNDFAPPTCSLSVAGTFYGLVLPTIVVNCATVIILLLLLYYVNSHTGIFRKNKNSWLCQITAPEVKISLIFCYLLALYIVLWISVTHGISTQEELAIALGTYFRCSINGIHDQQDCVQYRREFEDLALRWLHVLYNLLAAFLNISNLPLVVEFKKVKEVVLSLLGQHAVKDTPSHMGKQSKLST